MKKRAWTASEMGRKGGSQRAKKLTPEQRTRIAREGAVAMHKKRKAIKRLTLSTE